MSASSSTNTSQSRLWYPLPEPDDWTKVEDPRERKRVQNRVAQRIYRHRLKIRIEELQAKVAYHEQKMSLNADNNASRHVESQGVLPIAAGGTALSFVSQQQQQSFERLGGDERFGLQLEPLPTPSSLPKDLLFTNMPIPDCTSESGAASQDHVIQDLLALQAQSLDKLNDLRNGEANERQSQPQRSDVAKEMAEYQQQISALIPEILSDSCNHDSGKTLYEPSPCSISPTIQKPCANRYLDNERASPAIVSPEQQAPMSVHEGIEWLIDRIESLGFENFDALVSAYYATSFPGSSLIHIEQMLSRSRRLARVLSELFASSDQWPARERQQFNDEVTKISKSVLTNEGSSAHEALKLKLKSLMGDEGLDLGMRMDMDGNCSTTSLKKQVSAMKGIFINELPKLWTFLVGVSSANPTLRLKDRSNIALVIMLLLHLAGCVPKERLVRILLACL